MSYTGVRHSLLYYYDGLLVVGSCIDQLLNELMKTFNCLLSTNAQFTLKNISKRLNLPTLEFLYEFKGFN